MRDNFLINEEKTGGSRRVVLQKDVENTMEVACKNGESLQRNGDRKNIYAKSENSEVSQTHNEEKGLEEFDNYVICRKHNGQCEDVGHLPDQLV